MIKPLSIMIYRPNMRCGGVERFAINLCQCMLAQGLDVTLVLTEKKGERPSQVRRGTRIISLDSTPTLGALPGLKRERPDILLSSLGHDHIIGVWAKLLAGVKTAVSIDQHNALSSGSSSPTSGQHGILLLLYRIFSRFADGVFAVAKGVAEILRSSAAFHGNGFRSFTIRS